jgi:ATP-dependent helicase YprA (DUF1998 family)
MVDELVARGYSADRIHGDMCQAQREMVITKFRNSGLEFLVATDLAARGIDVDNIEVVFNYDLPWDEEDYVHRIGRTGRAGRSGRAFSLAAGREIYKLQSVELYTRTKIARRQVPSVDEVEEKRGNLFFEKIHVALQRGDFEKESRVVDRLLEQGFSSIDIACAVIHECGRTIRGTLKGQVTRPIKESHRGQWRNKKFSPCSMLGARTYSIIPTCIVWSPAAVSLRTAANGFPAGMDFSYPCGLLSRLFRRPFLKPR